MDRQYIRDHAVIERYLSGALTAEEEQAFEEAYLGDQELLDQVQAAERLRAVPGVKSASVTNQVTFGGGSWNSSVNLSPDQTHQTLSSTVYLGDEKLPETMGLRLVKGRYFNADEMLDWDTVIDRATFDSPGLSPLGIPYVIINGQFAVDSSSTTSARPGRVLRITEPSGVSSWMVH